MVDEEENVERHFSANDLRDLFKLNDTTVSDTHDTFKCKRCVAGLYIRNMAARVCSTTRAWTVGRILQILLILPPTDYQRRGG